MNDLTYWAMFFGAAAALNLSPGPDLLYILARTVAGGRRVGLASAAGVWTGAFVHVAAVALGLSAILVASARAFAVVKFLGAVYLVYLGFCALRAGGRVLDTAPGASPALSPATAFRQGVLTDLLNPKAAIFFMAFLPQFVRQGHGSAPLQLFTLGMLVIAVAIPVEVALVLAASRGTDFLRAHARAAAWMNRLSGGVLIALGVRLALETRGP